MKNPTIAATAEKTFLKNHSYWLPIKTKTHLEIISNPITHRTSIYLTRPITYHRADMASDLKGAIYRGPRMIVLVKPAAANVRTAEF